MARIMLLWPWAVQFMRHTLKGYNSFTFLLSSYTNIDIYFSTFFVIYLFYEHEFYISTFPACYFSYLVSMKLAEMFIRKLNHFFRVRATELDLGAEPVKIHLDQFSPLLTIGSCTIPRKKCILNA